MSRLFFSGRIVAIGLCLSAIFAVLQPSAAQAVPAHCDGEDAPPQCQHLPAGRPPALRTPSFTPASGKNIFRAGASVDPVVWNRQPSGTTYRAWIECTNGYTHLFVLRQISDSGLLSSTEITTMPGEAGGTCDYVTYDKLPLGLSRSRIIADRFVERDGWGDVVPEWIGRFE